MVANNFNRRKIRMDSHNSALYGKVFENFSKKGTFSFGPLTSDKLRRDPQYVMFQMSRYKHVARMFSHKRNVLDIGSGDGIGLPILSSYFKNVTSLDVDPIMSTQCEKNLDSAFNCSFLRHDFYTAPLQQKFDLAVCFDVLSSINPEQETPWFENIVKSLDQNGIFVIGTQNRNTARYSNPESQIEQPNFKDFSELEALFSSHFQNHLILSMNDETIHTGKRETCQYFIASGIGIKN